MLERQALFRKMKTLSLNNKKLLQSISTNMLNNPDEMQTKGHEHKNMLQKYNELMGFSEGNISQNEKMQEEIYNTNQKYNLLKQQIMYSKQQNFEEEEKMKRHYKEIEQKRKQESSYYENEIKKLKEEGQQIRKNHNREKRKYNEQIEKYKENIVNKERQITDLQQSYREEAHKYEQRMKEMQKIINGNSNDISKLHKESQYLEEELGKKMKKEMLNDLKELIGDAKKRNL